MGASSDIIKYVKFKFSVYLQIEVLIVGTIILNLERVVIPPSNNKLGITLEEPMKTILKQF